MKKFTDINLVIVFKIFLLLALVCITFFYTIPWLFSELTSQKEYLGIDLHAYWYSGLFFRDGVNPYAAILNNPNPNYWDPRYPGSGDPHLIPNDEYALNLPIRFLDGQQIVSYPIAQLLITPPSITAPLALLLWLFSWVSWPTAQLIWAICNVLFVIATPWLALRLPIKFSSLQFLDKLLLVFAFYNFYGIRQGILVGQQTLVCLFLIIVSLNFQKKWLISGILFGLTLSKYSVALPVFIFYLIYKKYRILLTSIFVQIVGILLLMPLKWGSPLETIKAYLIVIDVHKGQSGVQIMSTFTERWIVYFLVAVVIVAILLLMIKHLFSHDHTLVYDFEQLNQLNLLILAVLLTTYHRIYDMSLLIFFYLSLIVALSYEGKNACRKRSMLYLGCLGGSAIFLVYPTFVEKLVRILDLPSAMITKWLLPESVSTIILLLIFVISMYFSLTLSRRIDTTNELSQSSTL